MEATATELRNLVAERFDVPLERIRLESDLVDDFGATSLDVVDLVLAIEDRLGIVIDDSEAEVIRTFGDAVALVDAKRRVLAH